MCTSPADRVEWCHAVFPSLSAAISGWHYPYVKPFYHLVPGADWKVLEVITLCWTHGTIRGRFCALTETGEKWLTFNPFLKERDLSLPSPLLLPLLFRSILGREDHLPSSSRCCDASVSQLQYNKHTANSSEISFQDQAQEGWWFFNADLIYWWTIRAIKAVISRLTCYSNIQQSSGVNNP